MFDLDKHSSESEDEDEPENVQEKLLWAAYKGHTQLVEEILSNDRTIVNFCDAEEYTALHRASSEGYAEVVQMLLLYGANVHSRTIDVWTPLHCACKWNNADVAQLLLDNGADVNAISKGNATPLHAAASERRTREVLVLLLNHPSIDVNIKNKSGDTAYDMSKRHNSNSELFKLVAPHVSVCSW